MRKENSSGGVKRNANHVMYIVIIMLLILMLSGDEDSIIS